MCIRDSFIPAHDKSHTDVAAGVQPVFLEYLLVSYGDGFRLPQAFEMCIRDSPKSVSSDSLDPAFVAEEQEIAKQQLIQEGKPEHLLEKILPGKLKARYAQSCLLNQVFVKDPAGKMTVEALLNLSLIHI